MLGGNGQVGRAVAVELRDAGIRFTRSDRYTTEDLREDAWLATGISR